MDQKKIFYVLSIYIFFVNKKVTKKGKKFMFFCTHKYCTKKKIKALIWINIILCNNYIRFGKDGNKVLNRRKIISLMPALHFNFSYICVI